MHVHPSRRRWVDPRPSVAVLTAIVLGASLAVAQADAAMSPGAAVALGTEISALAPEASGTVIAAGADGDEILVRRLAADGTLRDRFVVGRGAGTGVTVQNDGGILVVGTGPRNRFGGPGQGFVKRFTADGRPDLGFGAAGTVPLTTMRPRAVTMAPGRRIVIAGTVTSRDGVQRGGLIRLLPTGEGDDRFGRGGVSTFDIGRNSTIDATVVNPTGAWCSRAGGLPACR